MPPDLDDAPALQHDDDIRPLNRREPVRDDERRAVAHQVRQRVLHERLRLGVERRGRLVEDQDRRVLEQRARDGQPLPLAAGQPLAPLADHRVVPLRQADDELVRARGAGRGLDRRRAARPGAPYAMLLAIVSSKSTVSCVTMPICSRSDARPTLRMSTPSIRIAPAGHVVEPRQQVDQARLARAAPADDRDRLARPRR